MKFGVKCILFAAIPVVFSVLPAATFAADAAVPTTADILVDGVSKSFDAYNINGNNYFKLRDVAFALDGSGKQFEVLWDADAGMVLLRTDAPYTAVGGELTAGNGEVKTPVPANMRVQLNGVLIAPDAYNIDGYNYFKLRDLGRSLHFGVHWDAATKSVLIATNEDYTEENTISYMKSFGTYSTAADWPESAELSQNDRYCYLKKGQSFGAAISMISVESGRHRYTAEDHPAFRDATYRQLLKQVSNDPDAGFLFGDGTTTARGYALCVFTIEYENVGRTDRMYYIVGDYKYVLITETDFHDKNAADITVAAKAIADSFEWAR
ncbi:MAG: copper amine oxidase N-terminal domain-containing protein [Clostridiales Family XIII bacterium]|jgi:hypothetical protein|nr:copper amine oxidase N-terminal domain-containing protein [Clostridiales Family XIII bacterium]